jgi:hypothetical protein
MQWQKACELGRATVGCSSPERPATKNALIFPSAMMKKVRDGHCPCQEARRYGQNKANMANTGQRWRRRRKQQQQT